MGFDMSAKPRRAKVGILFSGGPAPSANTVISSTALNFLDHNIPVIGFYRGYEFIQDFNINNPRLRKGTHFEEVTYDITHFRNDRGIYLRTSRANPGKEIKSMSDLQNPAKTHRLKNIIQACSTGDRRAGVDRRRRYARPRTSCISQCPSYTS